MNAPHESVEPLLSAYLDGELDPARRREVEAHLATCPTCAQELAQVRAGNAALDDLQPPPAPPDLEVGLRQRLRRQGANVALAGGLLVLIGLLVQSGVRDLAIVNRKDLPLWGRLGKAAGYVLMLGPGIALCVELLRDVRTLVEYAWLSHETTDTGEPQP
jgi:anti-sigma factor RsiW